MLNSKEVIRKQLLSINIIISQYITDLDQDHLSGSGSESLKLVPQCSLLMLQLFGRNRTYKMFSYKMFSYSSGPSKAR